MGSGCSSNLKCCQTSETAIEILHSLQSPPSQAGLSSHHDADGNSSVIQLQTTGIQSISQNSDCSSKSTHSAASASSSRSRVSPIPMLLEPIPQVQFTPEFLATDIADFTPSVPQASLGGSSKASTLTTYDGVEIRKKSILKQTKPVPKAKISAEVLLEKAIDRTLNYLQPQRRLYARERTLRHAYNWWDEESPAPSRPSSSMNMHRRPSKNVHFDCDRQNPSILVTLYRRGSLDSNCDTIVNRDYDPNFVLPGSVEEPIKMKDIVDKTLKLKVKWQKLRILLKAVTSFHGPEGTSTARSMSDPELGNTIREEEADIEQHKCIMAARKNTTWSI